MANFSPVSRGEKSALKRANWAYAARLLSKVVIYIQKFLHSDWQRACQSQTVQKRENF